MLPPSYSIWHKPHTEEYHLCKAVPVNEQESHGWKLCVVFMSSNNDEALAFYQAIVPLMKVHNINGAIV